jgi:hypothetical protein
MIEFRPEGCIYEPYSDIPKLSDIVHLKGGEIIE